MKPPSDAHRLGIHATVGSLVLAGALTIFGVGLDDPLIPALHPKMVKTAPSDPWNPAWREAPSASLATVHPEGPPRFVEIRALQDGRRLYLLAEWPDASPDMSYEGAYYAEAAAGPGVRTHEAVLLRDELEVRFAPSGAGSPYSRLAVAKGLGSWVWKSQWQADFNARPLEPILKKYPRDYVDDYPFREDVAYVSARAVENTAAISDTSGPARWLAASRRGSFGQLQSGSFEGRGVWRDGAWRVLFSVPLDGDGAGQALPAGWHDLVFSVTDGGSGERRSRRGLSTPLRVFIPERTEGGKP